jgi:hypothetical protein
MYGGKDKGILIVLSELNKYEMKMKQFFWIRVSRSYPYRIESFHPIPMSAMDNLMDHTFNSANLFQFYYLECIQVFIERPAPITATYVYFAFGFLI